MTCTVGPDLDVVSDDNVVKGKADPAEMRTLRDLLNHLSGCVVSKKSKNVEVLHIAAEVGDVFKTFMPVIVLLIFSRLIN